MSWDYLLVQVTNGAVMGVIYALIAVGVTVIFSILKIVNFAHGDLYMLGGYCAYYVIEYGGVPPLAAMVVAMAALFLGAMILERLMLTPLYSDATERKDEYGLIVTFGLAYFLRNTAVIAFGPFPLKPPSFIPGVQRIGNVIVTNDRLVAGGVGVALIVGLLYFMKRTIWGQALDAVSQSRDAAAIVGINAQRFNSFAFGFGAALAAAPALANAGRLNPYWTHVAIIAMYYGILAASWSLLAGYVGLFSLSHMAFASIGGYTSALLIQWFRLPIPLGIVAGVVMCCALGGAIGWVCLRMSGPYLAIFTLGFSEIVRITISTEDEVTAGMAGLHTHSLLASATRLPYLYVAFALLALSLLLMGLLVRSRWGLFFRAIREDEQAAAASGVAVARCRIVAFAVASGFAGLAGGFYAHYIGIMTPSLGDLDEMAKPLVMTLIGRMERLPTAVGGALVLGVLLGVLRED